MDENGKKQRRATDDKGNGAHQSSEDHLSNSPSRSLPLSERNLLFLRPSVDWEDVLAAQTGREDVSTRPTRRSTSISGPQSSTTGTTMYHDIQNLAKPSMIQDPAQRRINQTSQAAPNTTSFPSTSWVSGLRGPKARHHLDAAPFDLWDQSQNDHRSPSDAESSWIFTNYAATRIQYFGTWHVVVETPYLPDPTPLTLGGLAVTFVLPSPRVLAADPLVTWENAAYYANPSIPDPLREIHLPRDAFPTSQQMEAVQSALKPFVNIRSITYFTQLIIDIAWDERRYQPKSLPGVVGNTPTVYHHSVLPYWSRRREKAQRDRFITPDTSRNIQDTANYLRDRRDETGQSSYEAKLGPGMRVVSSPYDLARNPVASYATSTGVYLKNSSGQRRLTLANHGFPHSNEVWHPYFEEEGVVHPQRTQQEVNQGRGVCIGEVRERLEVEDVALTKLYSDEYDNATYFDCDVAPNKLLSHIELRKLKNNWFAVNGMANGKIDLQLVAIEKMNVPRLESAAPVPHAIFRDNNLIYKVLNMTVQEVADGVYGAPFVHQEGSNPGGVAGFFRFDHGDYLSGACVDKLIDQGWELV